MIHLIPTFHDFKSARLKIDLEQLAWINKPTSLYVFSWDPGGSVVKWKGFERSGMGKLASGPSLVSGKLCDLSQCWCLFVSTYVLRAEAATVDAASLRRHSGLVLWRSGLKHKWLSSKRMTLTLGKLLYFWIPVSSWDKQETHLWGTEVKMKQGIKSSMLSRLSARLFPSPSAIPPHPPKSVWQEEDGLITSLQRRKLRCAPGWMAFFKVIRTGSGEDKIGVQLSYFQIQQNFPLSAAKLCGYLVICMRKCLRK